MCQKLSMKDLLAHNATKQSLSNFLMESLVTHFESRSVNYAVAGNSQRISSFSQPLEHNHEEGDTLVPYLLSLLPVLDNVIVYATDTDIFVLLLKFRSMILCHHLFMQTSSDKCTNIRHNL